MSVLADRSCQGTEAPLTPTYRTAHTAARLSPLPPGVLRPCQPHLGPTQATTVKAKHLHTVPMQQSVGTEPPLALTGQHMSSYALSSMHAPALHAQT